MKGAFSFRKHSKNVYVSKRLYCSSSQHEVSNAKEILMYAFSFCLPYVIS